MDNERVFYSVDGSTVLAKVISLSKKSLSSSVFFSDKNENLQYGVISYSSNIINDYHIHKPVSRITQGTCEVLYILTGTGQLDILESQTHTEKISVEVNTGDLVVLLNGAHRLNSISSSLIMLEVKNGPYISRDEDKTYFQA